MEIHITFVGLCLFVPERDRVHVLLPNTGGDHRHDPQIFYAGIGIKSSSLNRFSLDLTDLHAGGATQPLPNVLDVEAVVGGPIPPDTAGNDAGQKVAVRITLPLADAVDPGDTAVWRVETEDGQVRDHELTHQLTWIIRDGDICNVDWVRTPLSGGGGGTERLGLPIPDPDGVVRIHVLHLPDHPHVVKVNEEAPHPQFFYALSNKPGKNPTLQSPPSPLCGRKALSPDDAGRAETAYNCMLGKTGTG